MKKGVGQIPRAMADGKKVFFDLVDEHHEAFFSWHQAKDEGFIEEPLDLFHIDAHGDMGRVEVFRESLYYPMDSAQDGYLDYYKKFVHRELNIGNFIFPAVLNGIIKNVYFIYPRWRNFQPRRKKLNVASAFGEGKIIKYNLKVDPQARSKAFVACPDWRSFLFFMKTIDKIPQKKKVILDIDLDYFACWDSIWNEMRYGLEITPEQFYNQEVFLRDKTLPFSRLEFQFVERNNKFYAEVGHRKGKELAHLPSKEEVEREIQTLVKTLAVKKVHPVVVTICRSCVSKYCPQDYVDFIEKRLAAQLRGLFPSGISPGRISCTPSKAKIRETRESEGKISSGERLDARPSAVD